MPKSAAQSDFTFHREVPVELPPAAWPVSLPEAPVHEASARVTRWMLWATAILMIALVVLCGIGLHIPSGG